MTTHRSRTKIGKAALFAALTSSLVMAAYAQEATPAPATEGEKKDENVTKLEKYEVTGSRIKRAEAEESLPITSFTKEEIDQQGITSAEQLLSYLNIAGNGSDNLSSNAGIVHEDQRGNNGVKEEELKAIDKEIKDIVVEAAKFAEEAPEPDATELHTDVLVESY